MNRMSAILLAAILLTLPGLLSAKSRSYSARHSRTSSTRCADCARDSRGRIKRSSEARHEYQRSNPCPSTGKTGGACPGYVIDHVKPLKRGGADAPSNMHWQTKADAKAKDRVE
jgi:hypothetical protein